MAERAAHTVPLVDLAPHHERVRSEIDRRIRTVLEHRRFIMGPEVEEFEERLAAFCGVPHAISCSSGTDALVLSLMAHGVGPGDAVFVPSFTFVATAEAVVLVGATPVFVDVSEETFLLDLESFGDALARLPSNLRPRAVIPVDLFGAPCDYPAVRTLCGADGILVLADAAQSLGGGGPQGRVGGLADMTATSFFPTKPLGCFGDGGAVLTDDDDLAAKIRSIRIHGGGEGKYDNVRIGLNARLDTLQAAILLAKLEVFEEELRLREDVAQRYSAGFARVAATPQAVSHGYRSAWAQYTIIVAERDLLVSRFRASSISFAIYYPEPLHRQPAYREFPVAPDGAPISERLSKSVISIPMYPYLAPEHQGRVIETIAEHCN